MEYKTYVARRRAKFSNIFEGPVNLPWGTERGKLVTAIEKQFTPKNKGMKPRKPGGLRFGMIPGASPINGQRMETIGYGMKIFTMPQ